MVKLSKQKIVDKYFGTIINYVLIPFKNINYKNTIIIYKLDGLGDAILTLPVIKQLKEQTSNKIIVACSSSNEAIFRNHKFIDKVIVFDTSKFNLSDLIKNTRLLRKEKAILSIDTSQSSNISAIMSFLTAFNTLGFKKTKGRSRNKVYNYSIELNPNKHMVNNYFNLVKVIGIKTPKEIKLVRLPTKVRSNNELVMVHPCTIIEQKKWADSKWVKVMEYLAKDNELVIIGSKDEAPLVKELLKRVKTKRYIDLSGRINLNDLIDLMPMVKLFVGIDGGPMHIASSFGINTIVLFGYETPIRYAPFNKNSISIYKDLPCSPCIKAYANQWPTCKDNKCMKDIKVEEVIKAIEKLQ